MQTYQIDLDPKIDDDINKISNIFNISRGEALKRAIILMKHASMAKEVNLTFENGDTQAVRLG